MGGGGTEPGDRAMAIWNAPYPVPGHEQKAVEAALAMQAAQGAFPPGPTAFSRPALPPTPSTSFISYLNFPKGG